METVYRGRLVTLELDAQRHEIVRHPPAVVAVAVDEEDRVVLVRQHRPAIGETTLEVPAGVVQPDEEPLAAARRELREEAQVEAEHWVGLGAYYSSPGFTDELIHFFLARGLREVAGSDPDEDVTEVRRVALGSALDERLANLQSVSAILLARRRLA